MMTVREEIEQLKKERNAVILAHYYVRPEVQEIADYIGDSFYLSKIAAGLKEQVIIFCGVSFMGESAKILNPEKTVLMPDASADCAMAHMADVQTIERVRKEYKDLAVVCYINSTAELKRHSDVCVTSANAVNIVRALPERNIFFIPDRHLAHFVAEQVPEKNLYTMTAAVRSMPGSVRKRYKRRRRNIRKRWFWLIRNVRRRCLRQPTILEVHPES